MNPGAWITSLLLRKITSELAVLVVIQTIVFQIETIESILQRNTGSRSSSIYMLRMSVLTLSAIIPIVAQANVTVAPFYVSSKVRFAIVTIRDDTDFKYKGKLLTYT